MKALTYFSVLFLFLQFGCDRGKASTSVIGTPTPLSALVLFKVGSAQANGRELNNGDVIKDRENIVVGDQSLLDLQLREPQSSITMRVQANSKLTLAAYDQNGKLNVSPLMERGGMMAQVAKLKGSESLQVRLPSAIAAVRGTKFAATVTPDGKSSVLVYDGQVATRARAAQLEGLPPGVIAQSEEMKAVVESLSKSETVLESGKQASYDVKATDDVIKSSGLAAVLSQPAIQKLQGKETASEQELKDARAVVQQQYSDPAQKAALTKAVEKPIAPAASSPVPKEDLDQRLKEFDEFVSIEQSKAKDDAAASALVREQIAQKRAVNLQRIESIMGKKSETLILKNGTRVEGVILQQGADYMVLTPEGRSVFRESEVSGYQF